MPELAPNRWFYRPAISLKACRLVGRPEPIISIFQLGANELNSMVAWQEKTE